ncbi:MAG: L,D-transpeptidase, partial [Anaerolineaceae bacterium]|nr:L,D-transpeptidase [Anaerolineaceae bacterium]
MKRFLPVILICLALSIFPLPGPAGAQPADTRQSHIGGQDRSANTGEPYGGQALCLPDVYQQEPGSCLPLGPSVYLTEMARLGLVLPLRNLPATAPDATLSAMTEQYLNVRANGNVPVYATIDDAVAHNPSRYIPGGKGLKYLAILRREDNERGIFFQLMSGEWINAGDSQTACCTSSGRFQGLLFRQNPSNDFGWVLNPTKTKRAPGYASPETGRELNRETIVQVYSMQKKDNMNWLLIGPDEWIDDQYVGRVQVNFTPPKGVDNGRWIEVNLGEQTLSVYENGKLVFATLIATGAKPFYTQPGVFKIYKKKPLETMSGAFEGDKSDFYYLEDVPWTMYFDEARALHGAYWRTLYGYAASHGCVNLSPGDSHWLFDWA